MHEQDWLAERFEQRRPRLRAVAYRMLGSLSEADDAVQEAWLRLSRSDAEEIHNLDAWLTTVVARLALNMLRSRERAARGALGARGCPSRTSTPRTGSTPSTRLCSRTRSGSRCWSCWRRCSGRAPRVRAARCSGSRSTRSRRRRPSPRRPRQLARRARAPRPGGARPPESEPDVARQREVIDAFVAAAREGDFEALVAVLDPEVVLRADGGPDVPRGASFEVRGAETVARRALDLLADGPRASIQALVNGAAAAPSR